MILKLSELIKNQAYIAGSWCDAASNDQFDVMNPATGEIITQVPAMGADETNTAITAAAEALTSWEKLTGKDRCKYLKDWYQLILDNIDNLSIILTQEQGKPLTEAKGEILAGAENIEWAAEEAKRIYGNFYDSHKPDAKIIIKKQAVGIVAAITPWNFPNAMVTRKIAPAIAAGCTIILKPSEETPLSALALAVLAEKAGIPAGVINIITTNREKTEEIGKIITNDKRIRKISFTGSTKIGKKLLEESAHDLKKMSLELGGNAPFIIFKDANIDNAVSASIASRFRNAGQTCICANRIYVHISIYQHFITKFTNAVKSLNIGNGMNKNIHIGPMINEQAIINAKSLVKDALSNGGKCIIGGKVAKQGDLFFEPTIITEANEDMRLFKEEIFSPVAAIYSFSSIDEIIKKANNTDSGLAAYIYTESNKTIWKMIDELEYGMIGVNDVAIGTELAPFGGIKHSGMGREGSYMALDDFTETKYILLGGI